MAKYARRRDLIVNTFAFQIFGKRRCDFTPDELKQYNRLKKRISRGTLTMEDLLNGKA